MGTFCITVVGLLPRQVVLALLKLPFVRFVFVAISGRNISEFWVKVPHITLLLVPLVLPLLILALHKVLVHRFAFLVVVLSPVIAGESLMESSVLVVERKLLISKFC
jgi:hypothetical protein